MTLGVALPNGCRITHGAGANIRTPFPDMPLEMHELHGGTADPAGPGFRGQFGFIPFSEAVRLPRHVHISDDGRLLPERILVFNGAGLVELNGELTVVAPGSLIDIPAGVPHTWTACPSGLALPDGSRTDGRFLMVYVYSEPTSFAPTAATGTLASATEYERWDGDLEPLRIPVLTADDLPGRARLVWDRGLLPL
ncbi:cupin domain-containing protein [Lichenicoccus roseus]|uniref:Cupin domain-containing protein n=1 Tax=Lichenicoccus roseus TaxID=2683649 RepID=A0A5R9J9T8_9PROT|nr:hypothetical protein [Lichenicoccus roseus]TLU70988.1 hypothetical protein FE263_19240 [Lichenicoccus roseus]